MTEDEIKINLKLILRKQEEIIDNEKNQTIINKEVRQDINDLNSKLILIENNYIMLIKQVESTTRVIENINQTLRDLNNNQIKLIETVNNNKEKTNGHSKLFWTMLTLNFSIVLAVITQLIRKII